jgi:hypothetical protein
MENIRKLETEIENLKREKREVEDKHFDYEDYYARK